MKPTYQFTEQSRQDRDETTSRRGSNLPRTDYSFQPASLAKQGRCFSALRPSFQSISREYLEGEARWDFASEAAFFVAIIVTAALPIASSMIALASLVRSFGAL